MENLATFYCKIKQFDPETRSLGTVLEPGELPGSRVPGTRGLPGSGTGNRGKPRHALLVNTHLFSLTSASVMGARLLRMS